MIDIENFKERIFSSNNFSFNTLSLEAFNYQYINNVIYRTFCQHLKIHPSSITHWREIPCLPISFFKSHEIKSGDWEAEQIFQSSGTTGVIRSKHHIKSMKFYLNVSSTIFQQQFGNIEDINIYAILPSYQQNNSSSLLAMVDNLLSRSLRPSGYYLQNQNIKSGQGKEMIFGVTYALLDSQISHNSIEKCVVMDTGGMKGRKKEITREEVINKLKRKFKQDVIWTEYGMTELTSQAYGQNGALTFPRWANVYIRDINDPFSRKAVNYSGGINVIDLANIDTCCFIETQDLGVIRENGYFEVLGRFDNSDVRGCSLLI